MNRKTHIILLLTILIFAKKIESYAQFDNISDSAYFAQMSVIDKSKLYKVVLLADNPFLCLSIVSDQYCGNAIVCFKDYEKWYSLHHETNDVSFSDYTISKLLGDTLVVKGNELKFNKVGHITKLNNLERCLDSCLILCNSGMFDYDLIASLFHSNILIERMEAKEDDGSPYVRFRFHFFNGTSSPLEQTNKLLNMSLINFLDSILPQQRFYLVMNSVFEPSQDFLQRYEDSLIRFYPCWDINVRKEIPKGALVVSLDSYYVFNGDCILTYKSFVAKKTISKGRRRIIAQSPKLIRFRYSYCEKQLDWVLKSVQSYSL